VNRKLVGIFTAVAASLLLVGVAWASGDPGDDPVSSSTQVSPTSDVSTPGSQTGEVTDTSVDDRLDSSRRDDNVGSTPTTIDDNGGSTPTTVDDNGGDRDNSGSDDNGGGDNSGSDDNGGDRDD
jgi:hypothetical protein